MTACATSLVASHWRSVPPSPGTRFGAIFADAFARRWQDAGRLALADAFGRELGINNIVVLERFRGPVVIADFRPDLARVEAFLHTLHDGGNGRSRPAA